MITKSPFFYTHDAILSARAEAGKGQRRWDKKWVYGYQTQRHDEWDVDLLLLSFKSNLQKETRVLSNLSKTERG